MNQGKRSKAGLFQLSIRSVLVLTAVVAVFFCGYRTSKDEIESLRKEVVRNRALADHAFSQLDELRAELRTPTIDHVMQEDANEWPKQLRSRLSISPEIVRDEILPMEQLTSFP